MFRVPGKARGTLANYGLRFCKYVNKLYQVKMFQVLAPTVFSWTMELEPGTLILSAIEALKISGGVAEWSKAAVLKTVVG